MKEEKRHKRGDVREDGMIFWQYIKSCKNGERWVTAEKFAEYREKRNARQRDRLREKVANDPEWHEKKKARMRDWHRDKRANDPEWVEKTNARMRDWHRDKRANDPEWVEKTKARQRDQRREKQANDPEYREKKKARMRDWHRERYANDPEYRAVVEVRNLVGRVEKGGKRSLEIYGVPTKELATKIRRGRLRIYNKYFKGVEKHLDHIRPLAEVKHSIEKMHKRSHFTNLLYIPAEANLSKGATPFWEWFAGLTDEKLKRCIAEQDAYNKKIQNQLNANA